MGRRYGNYDENDTSDTCRCLFQHCKRQLYVENGILSAERQCIEIELWIKAEDIISDIDVSSLNAIELFIALYFIQILNGVDIKVKLRSTLAFYYVQSIRCFAKFLLLYLLQQI